MVVGRALVYQISANDKVYVFHLALDHFPALRLRPVNQCNLGPRLDVVDLLDVLLDEVSETG